MLLPTVSLKYVMLWLNDTRSLHEAIKKELDAPIVDILLIFESNTHSLFLPCVAMSCNRINICQLRPTPPGDLWEQGDHKIMTDKQVWENLYHDQVIK